MKYDFKKSYIGFITDGVNKFKDSIGVLGILTLIMGIITLLSSFLFSYYVDAIEKAEDYSMIWGFLIVYGIVMLAKSGVGFLYSYLTSKSNLKIANDISVFCLQKLQKVSLLSSGNLNSVYLSERINSDSNVLSNFLVFSVNGLWLNVLMILVVQIILMLTDLKIGLLLMAGYLLYAISYICFIKPIYNKMLEYRETTANYLKGMNEQIDMIMYIQTNNLFDTFIGRFIKSFKILFKKGISYQVTSNMIGLIQGIIYLLVSGVVIYFGGRNVIGDTITIGRFTLIYTLSVSLLGNITNLANLAQGYQVAKSSYARMQEIMGMQELPNGEIVIDEVKNIEVDDLSFAYDENSGFRNFSQSFEMGKSYCLTGENGSGKSTFISILSGIYSHKFGRILINGTDVNDIDMRMFREKHLSVMFQNNSFQEGNAIEYICETLKREYSVKEIYKHIMSLGLDDLAMDFLELATMDMKDVNKLSGGEKHKVDIVRMLMKDAPIMIFDEATANLDLPAKEQFVRYLKSVRGKKLIIVISHESFDGDVFDLYVDMNQYRNEKME